MSEVDLIDLIYSAALNDNWQAIMDALRAATGDLVSTHIYGHDMATNEIALAAHSGYDPDMMVLYNQHFHALNVWVPGIARAPVGAVLSSRAYCTDDDLLASEFYHDWVKPHEDRGVGGGLVMFNDDRRFIMLGGNIRFKDRERAEPGWLSLLERIAPHVRNAFELRRRLGGERLVNRGYLDLIDRLDDGIFLLDGEGRIQFRNRTAVTLGVDCKLFLIDRAGMLRLTDMTADEKLQAGLAAIRHRDHAAMDATFPIRRPDRLRPLTGMLAPFAADRDATGYLSDFAAGRPPVAVLAVHDRLRSGSPQAPLAAAYGLTGAEAELALALHGGSSLQDHADQRGVSLHTVRNQLKSVFEKTGVHRQAELVALLSHRLG